MSNIPNALLDAIKSKGLSYAELERLTGISKSALQRYATGKTKKIPIDVIEKIAKATDSRLLHDIAVDEDFNQLFDSLKSTDPIRSYLEFQFATEQEIELALEIIRELSKLNINGLTEIKKNLDMYIRLEEYQS